MTDVCLNCGEKLKVGTFTSNQALPPTSLNLINLVRNEPLPSACNKCGDEQYYAARIELERQAQALRIELKQCLRHVPVVSLQQPMGWVYEPMTIVTAQTVTGTGLFSDVASAFTDLFGTQSGSYNAKLREGENLCKDQLRGQAIELGANAILGVDVDYAEVGGPRAMLMVCMTGTAVRITSQEQCDDQFFSTTAAATEKARRVRSIEKALQAPSHSR